MIERHEHVYTFFVFLLTLFHISASFASESKHLFILSGRSNMEGMHHEQDFNPYVERAFGKDNVIVVWDAKGGEPISRWYKDWTSISGSLPQIRGDLYDRLMTKVKAAIKGQKIKTVTFIWMQGETEARNSDGEVYGTSLLGLIFQLQHDLKRNDLNVVIGRISDYDMEDGKFPHWTIIHNSQVRFAESYPLADWINTDDLNDGFNRKGELISNDLHYSKSGYEILGYEILGKRFAEKEIELVEKFFNR
jgi:hypothetical protein